MATTAIPDVSTNAMRTQAASLLVCLPSATSEEANQLRTRILEVFPDSAVVFSGPALAEESPDVLHYPQAAHGESIWALTAKDYLAASQLALEHSCAATLVLGAESSSLSEEALRAMFGAVSDGADLASPRYTIGPHEALVSSAVLGPMTRALYGVTAHMPAPPDACFSLKMAQRLSIVAKKPAISGPQDPLLWPAAEAAVASLKVQEVKVGTRTLPQPTGGDLNSLLAQVIGSLFSDAETKATFWQRARVFTPATVAASTSAPGMPAEDAEELSAMVESFRNAYDNLQEIWALVLPPQSLFRVKKISRSIPEEFVFPADLWARTVYDFLMAYHLRSINRGHLLGAFTPLYLAWVVSHLRLSRGDTALSAAHAEETDTAFVTEKPYLVSRWRWPDRFNP